MSISPLESNAKIEPDKAETANRGRLYWFFANSAKGISNRIKKRPFFWIGVYVLAFCALCVERQVFQPYALWVRTHLIFVFLIVLFTTLIWLIVRRGRWLRKTSAALLLVLGTALGYFYGEDAHSFFSLWYRYVSLDIVKLSELPETGNERIQPLNSIFVTAQEKLGDTERALTPDFVRVGNEYRWTMAIEPEFYLKRLVFGEVRSVFNLSGTKASPDWSNREAVNFDVGEGLLWSHNAHTCVRRGFSFIKYFNYEPAEVRYLKDDTGQWVQVITLIKWKGFVFPRPEFGGVILVKPANGSFVSRLLRRVLLGCGEWVSPEAVSAHKFLVGQNIQSYLVSRYVAESFRFQNGFLAPFPGYHVGDIRIPDLSDDVNPQPFTTFFNIEGGKLFHYFALEPYSRERQGLSVSVLVPGDGERKVYIVSHQDSSVTGVSAVGSKIIGSRKEYDWSKNHPAEHRPFVHSVNGKSRLYWLSTIVTKKGDDALGGSVAGETPEAVLTDAVTNRTFWVNVNKSPEEWLSAINSEGQ